MNSWWFDGHLDLACLAVEGRDLLLPKQDAHGGPQPAGVTFPSLQDADVRLTMATIFTAPGFNAPYGYPHGDIQEAWLAGKKQLGIYKMWETLKIVEIVKDPSQLNTSSTQTPPPLKTILLMEGADPIQHPEQVDWWFEQGLRVVGLTWAMGTQYAGGNQTHQPLTDIGRECIKAIDRARIIHDISHLSEYATWELFELTDGPLIASHSNCRSFVNPLNQRHLTDDQIVEVGRRGGVIGINLLSRFLLPKGEKRRATIEETIAHIEHISELTGRRNSVALGSDMDGGFGTDQLPIGIDGPSGYPLLLEALAKRGWSDQELHGFAHQHWLDFFQTHLPTLKHNTE